MDLLLPRITVQFDERPAAGSDCIPINGYAVDMQRCDSMCNRFAIPALAMQGGDRESISILCGQARTDGGSQRWVSAELDKGIDAGVNGLVYCLFEQYRLAHVAAPIVRIEL